MFGRHDIDLCTLSSWDPCKELCATARFELWRRGDLLKILCFSMFFSFVFLRCDDTSLFVFQRLQKLIEFLHCPAICPLPFSRFSDYMFAAQALACRTDHWNRNDHTTWVFPETLGNTFGKLKDDLLGTSERNPRFESKSFQLSQLHCYTRSHLAHLATESLAFLWVVGTCWSWCAWLCVCK